MEGRGMKDVKLKEKQLNLKEKFTNLQHRVHFRPVSLAWINRKQLACSQLYFNGYLNGEEFHTHVKFESVRISVFMTLTIEGIVLFF